MTRGRLAPTPTGYLHVGHARTFALAAARASAGTLLYRTEDLDAGPALARTKMDRRT
jgi:glutamyl-tRNA synthetase